MAAAPGGASLTGEALARDAPRLTPDKDKLGQGLAARFDPLPRPAPVRGRESLGWLQLSPSDPLPLAAGMLGWGSNGGSEGALPNQPEDILMRREPRGANAL